MCIMINSTELLILFPECVALHKIILLPVKSHESTPHPSASSE